MEKSRTSYLRILIVLLVLSSCQPSYNYYKKQIDPADYEDLANRLHGGSGNYYQGNPANMILLRTALSYNIQSADIHRELGVPYLKRGFPVEFAEFYAESANLDPVNWQGWRGYLYLYFYRDYERALVDFDATDIHTPDFVDYPQSLSVDYMRAICYYFLNQPKKAIAYIKKHIKLETKTVGEAYIDSKSFLLHGLALQKLDKQTEALQLFEKAQEIDPDVSSILYHLADVHRSLGNQELALSYLDQAESSQTRGIIYRRNYMDEFFRIYQEDIDDLRATIQ